MPTPKDMKAWVKASAGADGVELATVPMPSISDDELLVRMQAIGVGIHDDYYLPKGISYPFPVGIEGAGVVEEVGAAVTEYRPGDRIAFVSAMQPKGGTWAEYAAVKQGGLILKLPETMTSAEGAGIPVAGNTIVRAIEAVTAPAGAWVFIAGASGAVGSLGIQLARKKGWHVVASASEPNHAYMRELGAEKVVDYRDSDWQQQVRAWFPDGVDAAIAVQPTTDAASLPVVRDGGQVVAISGGQVEGERGIHVQPVPHDADVSAEMRALVEDITAGQVRLVIDARPFDEGLAALRKMQSRHARGKTVLVMAPE